MIYPIIYFLLVGDSEMPELQPKSRGTGSPGHSGVQPTPNARTWDLGQPIVSFLVQFSDPTASKSERKWILKHKPGGHILHSFILWLHLRTRQSDQVAFILTAEGLSFISLSDNMWISSSKSLLDITRNNSLPAIQSCFSLVKLHMKLIIIVSGSTHQLK